MPCACVNQISFTLNSDITADSDTAYVVQDLSPTWYIDQARFLCKSAIAHGGKTLSEIVPLVLF